MSEILIITVPITLIYLAIQGWKNDKKWARLMVYFTVVFLALTAVVLAYFISAMSQTNWSL